MGRVLSSIGGAVKVIVRESGLAVDALARAGDRAVGVFSPDAGLRRRRSREMLTRAYEGASKRDGWRPRRGGASADADHAADARELRVRARSLRQNSPHIVQAMRTLVASVIGTGIEARWTGEEAETFNRLWKEMAPFIDADGRLETNGLIALAYDTAEQDGEVLIRIRPRLPSDGLPVPIQFQLLEIDWLDSLRTQANGNNSIVNGVEYDVLGKVVAYWLFDEHPGALPGARPSRRNTSSPVSAEKIIHFFRPERPGQGRGITRLAPVIALTRDTQLYKDAELQRKNLESRLSVLASGDPSGLANAPQLGGQPLEPSATMQTHDLGALPSGGITQMPTGTTFTVVSPTATPGYVEAMKLSQHEIAAGIGVPYSAMTGDGSDVNFSSARILGIDFRRECEMTQWNLVIPMLIARMCRAFADTCALAGKVKRPSYALDYATPKWDYVNPADEVKADLDEIAGGLSSISNKLRKRGERPELVFKELADDIKTLKSTGVLDVMLLLQKGRQLSDGAPAANAPTAAPPAPAPAKK